MQLEQKKLAAFDEIKKFTTLAESQIKGLENYVALLLQENDNCRETISFRWRHRKIPAMDERISSNKFRQVSHGYV
jgi:hypothetical protein